MRAEPSDPRIRRSGIGGSDIAAIVGQSPWSTAMDVWQEKLGLSAPLIETERMRWGTLLEDAIAREYAHKKHRKVRNAPTTLDPVTSLHARVVRYSADKPWRMANVDRLTSDPKDAGIRRGLECKNADRFAGVDFGEEGTDEVPVNYLLQCMWYLGVTGYDVWDLAVLIGGNTHKVYTIKRDEELIENLWTAADEFWTVNVLGKVPPPIDGSESSRRFLEGSHREPKEEIPMTDELYGLALHHGNLGRQLKDLAAAQDLVGNQIRESMQGKGIARRDNVKVTWSIVHSKRLDTTALVGAHPEVVAPFYVESDQHRLTVTVKEDA